jgi:anti-sigma B factor antagonist
VVIRQIGNELTKLVDASPRPRMVISFRGVEHLSSAALGTLLTVMNRVRAKDGQLRLCDIAPPIMQIFEITKLNKVLRIEKDLATARASLGK